MIKHFFNWYNRNYQFNLRFAAILFILQIVHLLWLTRNVVIFRLFGVILFPSELNWLLAVVDYTEIPAIIGVSLIYVNDLLIGKGSGKTWLYLILLNTQWLHLLWITDEIVLQIFTGYTPITIPIWLAWVAILIDYLELPVMWDTIKKVLEHKKPIT